MSSTARILPASHNALLRAEDARRECLARIDERFGWLKRLVALQGGAVESLEPHQRLLWHARESVVGTYNRVSQIPNLERRERAYRRLAAECTRLR